MTCLIRADNKRYRVPAFYNSGPNTDSPQHNRNQGEVITGGFSGRIDTQDG